jgi:hypothetical protein
MARTISAEVLATRLEAALGTRLKTLLLYGSAARGAGAHAPGRSDVNTLLICDVADEALFAALEPPLKDWVRSGQPPPLILTEEEWRDAANVFAIEYEDMRAAHRVLAGRDPWVGVVVRPEDVRRQLERELIGKLVRLRQGYVATREEGPALTRMIAVSLGGFFTMLRAALRLAGRPVPEPSADLLAQAAAAIGFPAEPLADLAAHAGGGARLKLRPRDPRAAAYLAAVARTAQFVDTL